MKKFLPFLLVFVILLLVLPRSARLNYDYRKGTPWKYGTLVAPFDFPILKTEDQLLEERRKASEQVVPYYRYREDVVSGSLRSAESLDLGDVAYMRPALVSELKTIYDKGVVDDDGMHLNSDVIYVQKDKRAAPMPASEVYVIADAKAELTAVLLDAYPEADSLLRTLPLQDLIVSNLAYDSQTTEQLSASALVNISPTEGYVSAGQLIVSEGEIVTAEIAQMLASYEKEYYSNMGVSKGGFLQWTGNALIALLFCFLLFNAVKLINPTIFGDNGKFLYLLLVFTIFTVASIVVPRTHADYVCWMPFVLCALLLEAYFDNKLVIMVYTIALLPLLFYADGGRAVFPMFLTGGVVSMLTFKFFNKGWRQFVNAFITFAVMYVLFLAFRFTDMIGGNLLRMAVALLVSAFLCVAFYPLTYLFEKIFNLVSVYRLGELCDTSNSLLRELEQKAPGTFQHSLQVMNMADAVAGAIGANVQLVRAGALYHDIGKMLNPLCFVENESMLAAEGVKRYHQGLSPQQSAQDIIHHITDGAELSRRHRLPSVITDFILTHHGTSVVSYFYDLFLKDGGDAAEIGEFRYPGHKPVSREQTILMLCDSVEAASRSLKEYTPESFDRFVEGIVAGKMDEGQFSEAELSVKDLGIVKATLKNYLAQMYHGRIEYPKRKIKLTNILK